MTLTRSCARAHVRVCATLLAVLGCFPPAQARAQGSTATIEVRVAGPPDGNSAARIPVRLTSIADPLQAWSADIAAGQTVR
jgi:hypothetical protein